MATKVAVGLKVSHIWKCFWISSARFYDKAGTAPTLVSEWADDRRVRCCCRESNRFGIHVGVLEALLQLLQVVSTSVGEALVPYMPRVIPSLNEMLSGRMPPDSEKYDKKNIVITRALDTVRVLGPSLLSHMHLIMSPLMQLVERTSLRKGIRLHALDTLYYLMDSIDVSPYLGTVLHILLHACHSEASDMAPWLSDVRAGDEAFLSLGGSSPALLWPTAIAVLQKLKQYVVAFCCFWVASFLHVH